MTVFMVDKALLCFETKAAHGTLERFVGTMCLQMNGQVAFDFESFAA